MKTRIVNLNPTGSTWLVPCPDGKRIRVLAVVMQPTATGEGNQHNLVFSRGSTTFIDMPTNGLTSATTEVVWGLGLGLSEPQQNNVDPATGNVTYRTGAPVCTAPLVDAWFNHDLQCSVSGTPSFVCVTYEEQE